MNNTIVGVDLAKELIQVCVYTNKKVQFNEEMTLVQFALWLLNAKPVTIVFEACGMSNYWMQRATALGHNALLILAKLVSVVRQNQKTDANDALAIVQATHLPEVKFIAGKTVEQQQLQTMKRLRELAVKQQTAASNQLKGLLSEFNIKGRSLVDTIQSTLEDAENGFSSEFRLALKAGLEYYLAIISAIKTYDGCLEKTAAAHPECKKLMSLEGVGPINAINLYIALGCAELGVFNKGKDASACIGLTPLQHLSGGKTKLGSIGKYVKNSILRSQLITGAMAAVNQTVRTAFAMLTQGTNDKAVLSKAFQ
jgi:transposase